jgi:hypothetical protein
MTGLQKYNALVRQCRQLGLPFYGKTKDLEARLAEAQSKVDLSPVTPSPEGVPNVEKWSMTSTSCAHAKIVAALRNVGECLTKREIYKELVKPDRSAAIGDKREESGTLPSEVEVSKPVEDLCVTGSHEGKVVPSLESSTMSPVDKFRRAELLVAAVARVAEASILTEQACGADHKATVTTKWALAATKAAWAKVKGEGTVLPAIEEPKLPTPPVPKVHHKPIPPVASLVVDGKVRTPVATEPWKKIVAEAPQAGVDLTNAEWAIVDGVLQVVNMAKVPSPTTAAAAAPQGHARPTNPGNSPAPAGNSPAQMTPTRCLACEGFGTLKNPSRRCDKCNGKGTSGNSPASPAQMIRPTPAGTVAAATESVAQAVPKATRPVSSRGTIFGRYSVSSICQWMGWQGWSIDEMRRALPLLGIDLSVVKPSTITTGKTDGKNPKYSVWLKGTAQPMTEAEMAHLVSLRGVPVAAAS